MDRETLLSRGLPQGTPESKRVTLGAGIGAAIEVYDFIGFGTAAALYLGAAFFPASSPALGTLFAFATLGVGFLVRPLGGVLAGHLGDRFGRKPIFVASLLLMGIGTVCLGLLPTYAQIGALAPILLVLIRMIQGLAFGAEWGGAILMTYEHAPLLRKGRYTGFMHAGFGAGLLLANLVYLATGPLNSSWSWRIPFLSSIVLILVGLLVRSKLGESPVFEQSEARADGAGGPLREVFAREWRLVVRGILIRLAEPAGYAIAVTFMLSYIADNGFATRAQALTALCVAAGTAIVVTPLWGALTDRIGRRPVFIGACLLGLLTAAPIFLLVQSTALGLITLALVIAYPLVSNGLVAAQGTILPEMFRPATRFTGCSLTYQFSAAIAGLTPFLASVLYMWMGWAGAAMLLAALCATSLIAVLGLPESWGPAERRLARTMMTEAAQVHDTPSVQSLDAETTATARR